MTSDILFSGLKDQASLQSSGKKLRFDNFLCVMMSKSSVYSNFKMMAKTTDLPFKRFQYFHFKHSHGYNINKCLQCKFY